MGRPWALLLVGHALEASRSDAQTIWTGFSMWGSSGAVLSPCWTEYVTLAVSCRPDTLWRNVISVACIHSHSFGHYTELLAGSKDWSVNRQLHFKAQHSLYRDRLVQHLDHYWHSTSLFRHMPLTFDSCNLLDWDGILPLSCFSKLGPRKRPELCLCDYSLLKRQDV